MASSRLLVPLIVLAISAPAVVALPVAHPQLGPIVGPDIIGAGETRDYANGTFVVLGDVDVQAGGALVFDHADVIFVAGAWKITVEAGASFRSTATTMRSDITGQTLGGLRKATFHVDLQPGAVLSLADTIVQDSDGVRIDGAASDLTNVTFVNDSTALDVRNVTMSVSGIKFLHDAYGLNVTNAALTLDHGNFTRNKVGLTIVNSDVSVDRSVFDTNDIGTDATGSKVTLTRSDVWAGTTGYQALGGVAQMDVDSFLEHVDPGTTAIHLVSMDAISITNTTIRDWEEGVLIDDSPATIEGNTIEDTTYYEIKQYDSQGLAPTRIANNTFAGGYGAFVTRDILGAAPSDLAFEDNVAQGTSMGTDGAALVRGNRVDAGQLVVSYGGLATGNLVTNGNGCFVITASDSESNVADGCFDGILLSDGATSTNDVVTNGTQTDCCLNNAFELLYGTAGRVTNATVGRGFDIGVNVGGVDGGWVLDNVTTTSARSEGIYVDVNAVNLTIRNSLVSNAPTGIEANTVTYLDWTRVLGNGIGVISKSGFVRGENDTFSGNAQYGADAAVDGQLIVPNSYWGSQTGPTTPDNPGGSGDAVTSNVAWKPFLTTPPVSA